MYLNLVLIWLNTGDKMAQRSGKNHNPWRRNPGPPQPQVVSDGTEKFKKASAEMQQAALKYTNAQDSSSDEEELAQDDILNSVIKNYSGHGKDLGKTREYLEQTFQSGAAVCLICIGSIKRIQPIWNCSTCFNAFHLPCIQRWAASSTYQQTEADNPSLGSVVRVNPSKKIEWGCPKCRESYTQEQIPSKYLCFCLKKLNPDFHPWLIPHSCGDTCDKDLVPACGHKCLLLCHPGSCPPCPKQVNTKCYCGQNGPKPMRCSAADWSCKGKCNKILACGSHKCEDQCHAGDCKPCAKTSSQKCRCGKLQQMRPCADLIWQCDNICQKPFQCGFHLCMEVCHARDCGECSLSGNQKCPCGAVKVFVTCPEEVGSCGGTCNKILSCEEHTCPNKCHQGICSPCLKLVDKTCRCGQHVKQLPCSKLYLCETKCKITKSCGRHACSKKCCDGNCLPCDKPCGKTLRCGRHKCPNVCHAGPCYPCPLTSRISCRCSATGYLVPCGSERRNKPPRCLKNCKIPANCNHAKENIHKCHFGACPTCKQPCGNKLLCGHSCSAVCHNAVPVLLPSPKPAGPWEVQPPKIEIRKLECPPCTVPVARPCLGGHEESSWACHEARITSCGRQCGRPLKCTNHTCSRECHPLMPETDENTKCENCNRSCEFPRSEGCKHPCKKGCHPPPCDNCQQYIKRKCHCGLTELFVQCFSITSLDNTIDALSCKQQCIRNLGCGHRCSAICHPDTCPSDCSKKTKIFCSCRRIKRDVACNLAKNEFIQCDDVCKEKKEAQEAILLEEEKKRQQEIDEKNQRELLEYEKKFGKRKHREFRSRNKTNEKEISFLSKYKLVIGGLIFIIIGIAAAYFTVN